ncbi:methyl-accepting chemotaxis protein, partial [Aurantimonas sp. 22II-16-19i]|uniref:HAMP domain-containing methyl-accepting chemotaxis protein n=1 Tax=Aurantimonas sp. 22II-16-19i TaxID=1317114 RepID=UPI0009F7EA51
MRLTLKAKLGATFAVIVALSGISMFVAIENLGNLNHSIEGIVKGNAARTELAATINARTLRIARDEKNYILANTQAEFERFRGQIETEEAALREEVAQLREMSSEAGKPLVDNFTETWNGFLAEHQKVEDLADLNSAKRSLDKVEEAGGLAEAALEPYRAMVQRLGVAATAGDGNAAVFRVYEAANDLEGTLSQVSLDLRNVLLTMSDPDAQKSYSEALDASIAELGRELDGVGALLPAAESRAFATFRDGVAAWLPVVKEAQAIAIENGDYYAYELGNGAAAVVRQKSVDALNAIIDLNKRQMAEASAAAADLYTFSRNLLLGLLIGSSLLAAIAATWIVLNISRAIASALGLARSVADGNLDATASVKTNDEIKDLIDALNAMVSKLKTVVGEVTGAARNVSSGSQEMSAAAEQLSQGATEQASSTEEASSSMEEM